MPATGPYGTPFWGIRPTGVPPSAGPGIHQLLPAPGPHAPQPIPSTRDEYAKMLYDVICKSTGDCISMSEPMPHVYPNFNTQIQQFSGSVVVWNGVANILAATEMSRAELGVTPVTPPLSQPRLTIAQFTTITGFANVWKQIEVQVWNGNMSQSDVTIDFVVDGQGPIFTQRVPADGNLCCDLSVFAVTWGQQVTRVVATTTSTTSPYLVTAAVRGYEIRVTRQNIPDDPASLVATPTRLGDRHKPNGRVT